MEQGRTNGHGGGPRHQASVEESTSVEVTSEWTTWSEYTETLEITSEADKWRELRFKLEPIIIIARTTTPFLTGTHVRTCVRTRRKKPNCRQVDIPILLLAFQMTSSEIFTSPFCTL